MASASSPLGAHSVSEDDLKAAGEQLSEDPLRLVPVPPLEPMEEVRAAAETPSARSSGGRSVRFFDAPEPEPEPEAMPGTPYPRTKNADSGAQPIVREKSSITAPRRARQVTTSNPALAGACVPPLSPQHLCSKPARASPLPAASAPFRALPARGHVSAHCHACLPVCVYAARGILNEAGAQKYGLKDTVKQKVKMLGSIRVLQTHLRRCVRAAAALLTCARTHATGFGCARCSSWRCCYRKLPLPTTPLR
jgi:hypothetical protein